jgi:hypothetical protein
LLGRAAGVYERKDLLGVHRLCRQPGIVSSTSSHTFYGTFNSELQLNFDNIHRKK